MTFRDTFHPDDIYGGFKPRPPKFFTAWGSEDPNFAAMIQHYQPKTIIEVGSWLGGSALHMASLCDAEILCVDTWTGSAEMYYDISDATRYGALSLRNGYPRIYEQFLSNVVAAGKQSQITPLALPSQAAAQAVKHHKLTADLIYIDAGHSQAEVEADLAAWYDVATGALFGDDAFTFIEVKWAVEKFAQERGLKPGFTERQWILEKK